VPRRSPRGKSVDRWADRRCSRRGCARLKGARRGNGEGSICQRRNGKWQGAVRLPDGRRRYVYGDSREEVRRKLSGTIQALEGGTLSDSRGMTVGGFLDQWLAEVVAPNRRPSTYKDYEVDVRLHLKPRIGHVSLEKLAPLQIQQLLNAKKASGLSAKSVREIRGTLSNALNHAIRWNLISRNPAAFVDAPRLEHYEINPLTPDEARIFLAALRGDRLEALYSVALAMGLRRGETLGLRWQDVDLDLGYLKVSRQQQRWARQTHLVEPKSARSRRPLVMPALIAASLKEHRDRQLLERAEAGGAWVETDLVFATKQGNHLDATGVSKAIHRHLDRAGLAQRRFHDLRHSCATLLLVQGVSPRVVMEILGHSQISLTMNTYTHVVPELRRQAAERMDELLGEREPDR
jgi:integrase